MRFFMYMGFIFTAMNLYIFWRVRTAFGPGKWQWAMLAFLTCMIWLFMQRRAVIGSPWEGLVHTVSLVWLGVVLITVTWLLALDGLRILAWITDHVAGTHLGHILRPTRSIPVTLGLCLLLCVYALFEATNVRAVHHTFRTDKLPAGSPPVRLAVMTDVHINALTGAWRVERMAKIAREADADILLMLGDLVDTDMKGKTREASILRSIPARLGKFAVLGNHEAYAGLNNSLQFTTLAGFRILRNEAAKSGGIVIAGMDDPMFFAGRTQGAATTEEAACLTLLRSIRNGDDKNAFTLLLRHRPGTYGSIAGLFDLQLSGHTHGGQIWPARFIAKRANGIASGIASGMVEVSGPNGASSVYVSPGTGFWGPPMRLFTPPEVTVIDILSKHE